MQRGTDGNGGARKRFRPSERNGDERESSDSRDAIPTLSKPNGNAARRSTVRCGKNSGDFMKKFRPPFFRRGCSKRCTGYDEDSAASSFELTVCATPKRGKLSSKLKRSKKKIRQISNRVKSRTKKSMKRLREMYESIGAKRAMGFDCDLRTCPSTFVECSASSCAKSDMLFGKSRGANEPKIMRDRSVGTRVDKRTNT